MTEPDITLPEENIITSAAVASSPPPDTTSAGANEYPISPEGRRQAIVLLLGVASLWLFAVWSLVNLFEGGLGGIEWVSLVLMLGIVLVAPVVGWALLEEANSRLVTDSEGLRYRSLMGIDLQYKWSELSSFEDRHQKSKVARFFLGEESDAGDENGSSTGRLAKDDVDEDATEADTRLIRTPDRTSEIRNPMARILHKLSHGSSLPLYSGIERRDELVRKIQSSEF